MFGLRLVHGLHGGLQIGAAVEGGGAHLVERGELFLKVVDAGDVVLIHRGALVEQHQKSDLGGAQADQRGFQVALILHALQLQAVQVNLRDVSGGKAGAADLQHMVVVLEVILGELQDGLGLQCADEGRAQAEEQRAFEIGLGAGGDGRALLRALQAEFALVLTLVQIADGGYGQQAATATVRGASGEGIELIGRQAERRVRPHVGRQLLRLGLFDVQLSGEERGIILLKALAHLIPAHGSLGLRGGHRGQQKRH